MRSAHGMRIGCLVLLSLVVGCGGGGDGDDEITYGAYWTGVDITTGGCGSEVHETMGSDVTEHSGNRIRIDLHIGETNDCYAQTFTIEGTQTGPTTWDMDDVSGAYFCALDHDYGYQFFDLSGGTIEKLGPDYELDCDMSVESGSVVCAGWFHVYMQPR